MEKEIREAEEAQEKYRSDWIKAEYETMGRDKKLEPVEIAIEPWIEE